MSFRRLVLVTHRWLGLATALVLSILGVTGAVLVWTHDSRLRQVAVAIHYRLAMGRLGTWMVDASTLLGTIVVVAGLLLWWKQKVVLIRTTAGWRRTIFDIHHSLGIVFFLNMFILAASGIGMAMTVEGRGMRPMIANLHTARAYPFLIKLLYTMGAIAFAVQGATGILMWWKAKQRNMEQSPRVGGKTSERLEEGIPL